ncbi:MAG: ribonuclease domain-containing protein [Erysipelotrichia bacterium]|nr:ribonuclease domain-containing protein [Erysipelotrichia bacterium]
MKKQNFFKKILNILFSIIVVLGLLWAKEYFLNTKPVTENTLIQQDQYYYDKDNVALFIHTFNCLPSNYITKDEARQAGWNGGSVEVYLPDKAIGGDIFSNYEKLLPTKEGRIYYECDIDTHGKDSRGAKRIIYSNDGLIYYTDDHYESFELLYGD